jgi:hypothetical protein
VAGVLGNRGSALALTHSFGTWLPLTGCASTLFLHGIVVGAAGLRGLSLLLTGAPHFTTWQGREARAQAVAPRDRSGQPGARRPDQSVRHCRRRHWQHAGQRHCPPGHASARTTIAGADSAPSLSDSAPSRPPAHIQSGGPARPPLIPPRARPHPKCLPALPPPQNDSPEAFQTGIGERIAHGQGLKVGTKMATVDRRLTGSRRSPGAPARTGWACGRRLAGKRAGGRRLLRGQHLRPPRPAFGASPRKPSPAQVICSDAVCGRRSWGSRRCS